MNEYGASWAGFLVAFLVLQRRYYRSVSPFLSLSPAPLSSHRSNQIFSSAAISSSFALVHHHRCRRMTINNSKTDSPPPSLVPSFNHHCFVSFGSTVASIIVRNPSSSSSTAANAPVCLMRPPCHYRRCLY